MSDDTNTIDKSEFNKVRRINSIMLGAVWCLLLTSSEVAVVTAENYAPIRQLAQGYVRGVESADQKYYQYMGIPYATVTKRFQVAGPPKNWSGIFEADSDSMRCFQIDNRENKFVGQEDCLTVNVYTPKKTSQTKLMSVVVYIFGGMNVFGSYDLEHHDPKHFVENDIIVVMVSFRFGVYGYLCLGIKESPGNMGMKDIVAALRWVKVNIKQFGGDPDRVTLTGHSSGSNAVLYQLLSPMSAGLINQVMTVSSGSMHCTLDEDAVGNAKAIAKRMGYKTETVYDILNVFLNADPEHVVKATQFSDKQLQLPISACVEKVIAGEERFLSMMPYDILVSGNYTALPIMNGFSNNEGLYVADMLNFTYIYKHLKDYLPLDMRFRNETEKADVVLKIHQFYYKNAPKSDLQTRADWVSDVLFTYHGRTASLLHHKISHYPVYSHIFEYDGGRNVYKMNLKKYNNLPGATHADILSYLNDFSYPNTSEADQLVIDRLTTMLANFIKYGDPTPNITTLLPIKWAPMNETDNNFLLIDTTMGYIDEPFKERMDFWNDLYKRYRKTYSYNESTNSYARPYLIFCVFTFLVIIVF